MAQEYRIGKVAKATGVPADTLRVWERRYAVVAPSRTEAGGRVYTESDIQRLRLIKQLIDAGDSISKVAPLSQEELQARLQDAVTTLAPIATEEPLRLITVGPRLSAQVDREHESLSGLELVEEYRSLAELDAAPTLPAADVLFIEIPTVHDSSALALADLMTRLNLQHVFVIYRFASRQVLSRLSQQRFTTLKGPLEMATLRELCLSVCRARPRSADSIQSDFLPLDVRPRRFNDADLDRIASMTPVIECECPRHLADLLSNLSAFEQYSAECEHRNEADAQLHAYLNRTAGQARQLIEQALGQVLEAEGISL